MKPATTIRTPPVPRLLRRCAGATAIALALAALGEGDSGSPDQRSNGIVLGPADAAAVARPPIRPWLIPFSPARRRDTAAYTRRHYGRATTRLQPRVIVQHFSVTATARAVYNTFAPNAPDRELRELPGLCSHFVVDRDGTIFQLVGLDLVCRHTVGLNHVAIGVEHVGFSDAAVLGNPRQLTASLRLSAWLRCRYRIPIGDVIGHAESLSSRYHHESVPRLRRQTHGDFQPRTMRRYRGQLGARRC